MAKDDPDYEKKYGDLMTAFAEAAGEMTRKNDVYGIRFMIECCDAILGRALVIIESQLIRSKGMEN